MESVQKLDNMRMQRNNTKVAPSPSLSSSSSCVSVTEEEPSVEESIPRTQVDVKSRGESSVASTPVEVKEKNGGKFQNDKKPNRDSKKRRPLTVLKSQNIECTRARSPSVSENSLFHGAKSQSIPKDLLLLDVKLNGLKPLVLPKSKLQTISKTADSTDTMPARDKADKKFEKEICDSTEDCTRQIENRKLSKRQTTAQKEDKQRLETGIEQKPSIKGKEADDVDSSGLPLRPDASSPSLLVSSRKGRKHKNKDTVFGKVQRPAKSPGQGSTPPTEGPTRGSLEALPDVNEKQCLRTVSSKGLEFDCRERKKLGSCAKENNSEQAKVESMRPNVYKSSSGVAELDTFEIMSSRKKLLKKRCKEVPSTETLNELDTFDDPIVNVVRRSSNESLGTVSATPEIDEKWIEVNRRVKRVVVPLNVVSRILGPNGSKLEAICNFTKAHIEQEKAGNIKETTFVIRGTLEQMQAAYSMIQALIKGCHSTDSVKNGCSTQTEPELSADLLLQKSSDKLEGKSCKESKVRAKLQRLPVVGAAPNGDKNNTFATQGASEQQLDEGYQESVKSGTSERSEDPTCSERSSPDQDLLIGEYSLFEHGLGQPLKKLLACKDSSKQTFAYAAGSRSTSRTLTVASPNNGIIDQTLLAKAPGYRNVKSLISRDLCCSRVGDFNGRVIFPWKCGEQFSGSEASYCHSSHLVPIDSRNFSIPLLERPISAPTQPLPHSACSNSLAITRNSLATHSFSKLNPNAPDFIFSSSSEAAAESHCIDSHINGSDCVQNVLEPGFSYAAAFDRGGFKPLAEVMSAAPDGISCQEPAPTAEDAMYALPIGDGLSPPWIRSQESWNAPKLPYGIVGGEHAPAGTYRGYFSHSTLAPNAASPYRCVFYQHQQQMMLAPVQSWVQGSQTLAQAGP